MSPVVGLGLVSADCEAAAYLVLEILQHDSDEPLPLEQHSENAAACKIESTS